MYLRIFLNITKHKVLNLLLIFLFILSFVGITFSSVFVYKTSKFLNEIYKGDSFTVVSSSSFEETSYSYAELDINMYKEIYETGKSNKNLDVNIVVSPMNIEIKEFSSMFEQNFAYVEIINDENYAKSAVFEEGVEFENDKAYLQTSLAQKYNVNVGDNLTIISYDFNSPTAEGGYEAEDVTTIEVGGIYEKNPDSQFGSSTEELYMMYIPSEFILNIENQEKITYGDAVINAVGSKSDIDKYTDEIKDYSNDVNIYDSTTYREKDLNFFKKTRNFFIAVLLTSMIVFAISFMSLNNNVMDRRNDEFRLYNVFGLSSKDILLQINLEKVVLFILSLIIAIPLFLRVLILGNNIVDNLVKYSIENDTLLFSLIERTGQDELSEFLYGGISMIEVSKLLVIALGIVIMMAIVILITTVQFIIDRERIVNQRRGE